jgi:CubicO group peptidase (beta-lactamase class C family)
VSRVDCGDVPGIVAAAATTDGPIFEGAIGKRDLANSAAMTADTAVRIASKAVAGACAMQLVEQGKLDLESPIARILPELENPQVLEGFDANGEPKLRKAARPITLRHLLTHSTTSSDLSPMIFNSSIVRFILGNAPCGAMNNVSTSILRRDAICARSL